MLRKGNRYLIFCTLCFICLLGLSGCTKKNNVEVKWYSLNCNIDPDIRLSFKKVYNSHKTKRSIFTLVKNKTNSLSIPLGYELSSVQYNEICSYCIYPRIENYSDQTNEIEVYSYKPNIEKKIKNEYTFEKCDSVDGYFIVLERDGELFTAVSKDNVINLNNIKNISITSPEEIIQNIQQNDILIDEGKYNNSILEYGYIIKSKIDKRIVWLPIS